MQWHESKAPICSILDILLLSSFPRMCQARQRALYYSLSLFLSILLQVPMQERQEIWVWSLGWEDPLEEEMATQSSIIAWKTPWTEEPGRLQSMGSQRVRHDWGHAHMQTDRQTHTHTHEGTGKRNIFKERIHSVKTQLNAPVAAWK